MKAENDVEKLEAIDSISPEKIPFIYFDHRERRTTKLINNEDELNAVKGKKREFLFELKEPIFLIGVVIVARGYSKGAKCDFKSLGGLQGDKVFNPSMDEGGCWKVSVSDIVTGFSFVPPKRYIANPYIESVYVYGLEVSEISRALLEIGRMENLKSDILEECKKRIEGVHEKESLLISLEEKKAALDESIEEASQELTDVEEAISEREKELSSLKNDVENVEKNLNQTQARIETANSHIETKTQQRQQLTADVEKAKNELKRLEDNINLFPTEVKGFVEQGAENIKQYITLAAIPIFIIAAVTGMLFLNAADLTHYSSRENRAVWEIIISRIPYVSVCAAILAACYKLSRIFISEIMRINEQRLNLTKVGIIAKDVTDACNDGLELDDEIRYENRVRLKMELLREHLKNYIGEEYEYNPKKKTSKKNGEVDEGDLDNSRVTDDVPD